MDIERNGAERDRGTYDTKLTIRSVAWSEDSSALVLKAYYVPDFATDARHHWKISLTTDETLEVMKAFSERIADNEQVRKAFSPQLIRTLLELAIAACPKSNQPDKPAT